MRKPLDISTACPARHLHALQSERVDRARTPSLTAGIPVERMRIADRMADVLIMMTPEACEHVLRLAELMALKHPAAPRMYLVRTGQSATRGNEAGDVR